MEGPEGAATKLRSGPFAVAILAQGEDSPLVLGDTAHSVDSLVVFGLVLFVCNHFTSNYPGS
eukprot:1399851-Amphidinium_carterae.1